MHVLGHHPIHPTGLVCSGSEPMNPCPMRIAIVQGPTTVCETLVIARFIEGPDRLCCVTTTPQNQLPTHGRAEIFGIHLGTYHACLGQLGDDRCKLVVIYVYKSHHKLGKQFDLHVGEGYFLPDFNAPIVDKPAVPAVIGGSVSTLLCELKTVPGLQLQDAKDLAQKARSAARSTSVYRGGWLPSDPKA